MSQEETAELLRAELEGMIWSSFDFAGMVDTPIEDTDREWVAELIDRTMESEAVQNLLSRDAEAPVEYEYGWAPYSDSNRMFPTEERAKESYFMAVGHPVRHWKREIRKAPQWILADDQI